MAAAADRRDSVKFSDPEEARRTILGLAGATTAADDQARAMTDKELGELLLSGRWSTIEVHEAGRRLMRRGETPQNTDG
jgi:hypothetical protein